MLSVRKIIILIHFSVQNVKKGGIFCLFCEIGFHMCPILTCDTLHIPRHKINIWETLISKTITISMKDITIINIRTTTDKLEVLRDRFQPLKWDKSGSVTPKCVLSAMWPSLFLFLFL